MKKNIYIYGAGNEYNRLMTVMPLHEGCINILGIITSTRLPYSRIDNYRCYCVEEVDLNKADYIIIAVGKYKEIITILHNKEVCDEKIIVSYVFFTPGFEFEKYLKLKESNVSILSDYWVGGLVYKQLGLRALSPTINMFCAGKDYLEFLENYEYYLDCEMEEYIRQDYLDGTQGEQSFYEKGILGKRIVWNFNHDIDAKIAIEKWNQRKARFNKNNVAAIMIIQCDEDAYRFSELNIEKKIGIYYKDLNLKDIIFCPEWCSSKTEKYKMAGNWPRYANMYLIDRGDEKTQVINRYGIDTLGYRSPINWIDFLLGEKDYKRVEYNSFIEEQCKEQRE